MNIQFKNVIGHERIKEQLSRTIESGKLGHAYLFSGEGGVGKFPMAFELAMAYLCKSEIQIPCGVCDSCQSIKRYTNSNFQYLFPLKLDADMRASNKEVNDKGFAYIHEKTLDRIEEPYSMISDYSAPIYIERIRDMNNFISSRRGKKSVTIIDGIDNLSDKDLNTMLKTLEEPPTGALIILLSRFSVLPTIRSRCIVYKFAAPNSQEVKDWLKIKASLKSDAEISYIAEISQNIPGVALTKLSESGEKAQELAEQFSKIVFCEKSDFERFKNLENYAEKLVRDVDLAQRILVYFISQIRRGFLFAANSTDTKPEIYIPNFKDFEQAQKICEAIDNSILSVKRYSPLTMVFTDLTINLMRIYK